MILPVLLLNLFHVVFCKNHSDDVLLVKDVLRFYAQNLPRVHYKVVHFSCDRKESLDMLEVLTANNFYINSINLNTEQIPYYVPSEFMIYILNLSCGKADELLKKVNNYRLFSSPNRWIFINSTNYDNTDLLINTDILGDSDVTLANTEYDRSFKLYKIYKRMKQSEYILEDFGFWNTDDGFVPVDVFEKNRAIRRQDFQGTIINTCIVITHNNTYKHLTDKREKHIDTIAKVNYVFTEHLADFLNATMNYSVEDTWGYKDNNSRWTGMIGELTSKRADIGGTALFLTSDRVSIIDYIAMTTPTRSKFVFRQPKLSYITNVFTLPFSTDVWVSSISLVFITGFGLYLVIKWEWYKKRNDVKEFEELEYSETDLQDSFSDVMFVALGAVCQQGASAVPTNTSGRVITILLFVSLMFLYTSYSANIVALLQSSSTSIQTLEDLLHSRLQVGVDDTVFNHFYFPNASEPIRRALYLQKVAPHGQQPRYFPIEEGVRRLQQGLFAFHMETGAGYKIVSETFLEDEKCDLEEIQFLQVPDPWLAIQKNSSYKEILKIGLRKLHESGIQPREVSLLYTKKPVCASRGSSYIGVGIIDCYPAAEIFAIGIGCAFIIFLFEYLYHKYKFK